MEHVLTFPRICEKILFEDDYVDLDELLERNPEAYLISDGIHLRGEAHARIADYLYARVTQLIGQSEAEEQ